MSVSGDFLVLPIQLRKAEKSELAPTFRLIFFTQIVTDQNLKKKKKQIFDRFFDHRIGIGRGAIRISEDDIEAYLASCRVEKGRPPRRATRLKLKHLKL